MRDLQRKAFLRGTGFAATACTTGILHTRKANKAVKALAPAYVYGRVYKRLWALQSASN